MSPGAVTPLRAAAAIVIAAAAAQLVPVDRSNPPVGIELDAPADVRAILERSCFDCHSHHTRWPWYSRVAPVSWLVARDVREGRREMNFSEWPAFDLEEQDHLLASVVKQVERGKMPLPIYVIMHGEARLSAADRRRLTDWARGD